MEKIVKYLCLYFALNLVSRYTKKNGNISKQQEISTDLRKKKEYYKRTMAANKLLNEESNRLISWAISIIGGSILIIISTNYVNPTGWIIYCYSLFAVGWFLCGKSIFHGEAATRRYIAGVTTREDDLDQILLIGRDIDIDFDKQLKSFRWAVFSFSIWLAAFLLWFIIYKN